MQLANGIFLIAALLIPLGVALYFRAEKRRGSLVFSDIAPFKAMGASPMLKLRHIAIILRVIAVAMIVVALARPQSTTKTQTLHTEGIDIMLTLDASGSMQNKDFKPLNRFEAAKEVISQFISQTKDNRLGLVLYATNAYTQCPLTLDYSVLLNILDRTNLEMIDNKRTAIGLAIATAVNRLKDSDAKSKVIILLTDGQNNAGEIHPFTASKLAKTFGIKIYTIAMGKENSPVMIQDPIFGERPARNPDGSLVYDNPDVDTLAEIARLTGGRFFRATDEKKLAEIYSDIAKMEKSKIKTEQKINYTEYFQLFLLPAIGLLLLELVLTYTRFRVTP